MSEAKKKILQLLSEGKITVEESEELLAAIDKGSDNKQAKEETRSQSSSNSSEKNSTEDGSEKFKHRNNNPFFEAGKLGFDLKNLAQTVQNTVETAIKRAEPKSRELKVKMKEFGAWMHELVGTIAEDIASVDGELIDAEPVDFCITSPGNSESCDKFTFENTFGSVQIVEGEKFKIQVTGRVAKNTLGEYKGKQWFENNAVKITNDEVFIGLDKNKSVKAAIDMLITLPLKKIISCKTIASDIKVIGEYRVNELKTVSGTIVVRGAKLLESVVESVSGNIQIEGGEISLQLKSTSGDFLVKNSDIRTLKINSVSGNILLTEGNVDADTETRLVTTSGDIIVEKMNGPWGIVEAITRTGVSNLDWKGDATPLNNQGTQLKSGAEGAKFIAESVSGDIQFN